MVPVLFLGLMLAGCGDNSAATKKPSLFGGAEMVLPGIYDDQQNTVYIKANRESSGEEDAAVTDIMTKKKEWEKRFPAKKVIAMSIVTGDWGGYGHPIIVGLLIHYEQR